MSTLEKLFVQIFERKAQIIEQIQQQADSYTQQLASTLLIDGITPPSWLLNPNYSNFDELEKEDIISKLLLRPTRDSVAYSRGNCSLYSQLVVSGNDGRLSKETCVEITAPNKGLHVSDELMKTLECENNETSECPDKDEGYSLSCAAEKDDGMISPQNETDARISSIYSAPDMSLVRIQRSKSRQIALELRTSGKATVKSCVGNGNRTDISISGELKSDFRHVSQDKCPSEVDKCNDMSGATSISAEGKVEKGNDRTSQSSRLAKSSSINESPSYVNDPSKNSSSFEKDALDVGNQVQAIGNMLQQPGHSVAVMKGGMHPEVCLGSNVSRKSITEKTQDTQRHNKAFCGRITRSRSSIEQTSGIDKSSNLGTSDSCIPKEYGGALPQFVSNLMVGLDAANKLSDAVETSQVLNDRIGESQAVSRNEGLLKQVNSSNVVGAQVMRSRSVPMNESQLAANHQESANVVVGIGPREAPVVIQTVSSGIKLDAVTLYTEGLASRQSLDCSMAVKPKQLNFDEIDECVINEVRSPLSKKRRLDGLSRDECYPSKESASSVIYKSSGNFFEQQLTETDVLSNSPIAAMTHFHNKIECAKDETPNIGLDKNEKPMVDAVEHNSKVSLYDNIDVTCEIDTSPKEVHNILNEEKHSEKSHLSEDRTSLPEMQIEEGVLGHKGEQSVAGDASSSFSLNLTKQGNRDSEDFLDNEVRILEKDLGSSKSKEFDVGTNLKLPNVKLNSAKFNTWPENQQRNLEDQPNCFSDSRGYRVHIQRDAIHCDLEATENDLNSVMESASVLPSDEMHVSLSDGIPSCDRRVCDDMMCDLPEGTALLHKLQAAEANATEVGDDTTETTYTPKHSSPTRISNLIRNAAEDSTYSLVADVEPTNSSSIDDVITDSKNSEISFSEWVSSFASFQSSQTDDKSVIVSDEFMPVYEGFIIDQEVENVSMENAEGGVDFHALEIPSTTIARASIIEQSCKSATMETPLSLFSSKLTQPQVQDMYGIMADETLVQMDLGSIVSLDEDSKKHLQTSNSDFNEICRAFENEQPFDSVPLAASPYYWQSKSHYLSPVGKFWERSASSSGSSENQLSSNPELTCFPIEEDPRSDEESEQRENDDDMAVEKEPPPEVNEICSQHANRVSLPRKYPDRCSSNSVNIELSVPRTHDNVKYKPKNHPGIKISRFGEDNRTSSIATWASSRGNVSEYSKAKSSLRSGIPRVSQKEIKRNNIVSNDVQMDLGSIVSLDEDSKKHLQTSNSDFNEICLAFENEQPFDSVPLAASPYYWQSKSHYLSPVGKFWERSASSSGSSEKQLSSNPELTCFPIEEDPRSDEESELRENDDDMAVEKEPPPEVIEICSQHANRVSLSRKYPDRCSSNSVNIELSVPRTHDNVKYKPKNHPGIKISRFGEDNRTSSIATRASSRGNVSEYSKAKSSLRSGIPRVSQKEIKRNNIVSNITSFIPIVQQKQAAAVCTGKRDIKVKALEAAEAAKRREQEKENERKMKKEALKLERARIGKENAREMELDKKKKQDALKKKEADIAARKRQREEEEKKQVAKKRKLVAEAQQNQKLQYEKSRFVKVELEKQQNKNAAIAGNKKGSENLRQTKNADENSSHRHNTELKTDKALASVIQQVASVPEKRDVSFDCGEKEKPTSVLKNTPVKVESVKLTSQENSYDISPYQCSDDEDDEEDDRPSKKFVPSWASKSRVAMVLPLQQSLNPETIFPVESFCSMDEVLLPRRLQQAQ